MKAGLSLIARNSEQSNRMKPSNYVLRRKKPFGLQLPQSRERNQKYMSLRPASLRLGVFALRVITLAAAGWYRFQLTRFALNRVARVIHSLAVSLDLCKRKPGGFKLLL